MKKKLKAKCLLVSLPDMEKDPSFPQKMDGLANELEKIMTQTIGEEVEVVLWNTNVEFVTALQIANLIKGLKKIQKRID